MNQELTNLLEGEIKEEFNELEGLSPGSKEQTAAINNIIKLYRLRLDEDKTKADIDKLKNDHSLAVRKYNQDIITGNARHEEEIGIKAMEFDKQRKENIFKWCIGAAELVLPLIFYATWMRRGFQFEKDGTYTSTTFRNLFNNFKPIKK